MSDFFKSTVSAGVELFGASPSRDVVKWRQDNPLGAISGDLIGALGVYLPYLKFATKAPAVKALVAHTNRIQNPILRQAAAEATRFAPLELARAGGKYFQDNPIETVAADTILALGFEAGFGAVGGIAKAIDVSGFAATKVPVIIVGEPAQIQLFKAQSALDKKEISRNDFNEIAAGLKDSIIFNNAVGSRYTSIPELNNVWKRGEQIKSEVEIDTAGPLQEFVTGEDFLWFTKIQYPRIIKPATVGLADVPKVPHVIKTPAGKVKQAGQEFGLPINETQTHKLFMRREGEGGLYVMYMQARDPDATDLLFKTAEPSKFTTGMIATERDKVLDLLSTQADIRPLTDAGDAEMLASYYEFDQLNPRTMFEIGRKSNEQVSEIMGFDFSTTPAKQAVQKWIASFAPTMFQFRHSTQAQSLIVRGKMLQDKADQMAGKALIGNPVYNTERSILKNALSQKTSEGGILGNADAVDNWDKLARSLLVKTQDHDTYESFFAEHGKDLTNNQTNFFQDIYREWEKARGQLEKTAEYVGVNVSRRDLLLRGAGVTNHYKGTWRSEVFYKGTRIFLASGTTKREALEHAKKLKEAGNFKQGLIDLGDDITFGEATTHNKLQDREWEQSYHVFAGDGAKDTVAYNLYRITRANSLKLEGGFNRAPTRAEFKDNFSDRMRDIQKFTARMIGQNELLPELMQLTADDPKTAKQVLSRLNDFWGISTDFTKLQNEAVAAIPGARELLGNEPLTNFARYTNTSLMNLQLGMGNLGFAALNMSSVLQTTLPAMALVTSFGKGRGVDEFNHFYGEIGPRLQRALADQMHGKYRPALSDKFSEISPVISERGVEGEIMKPSILKIFAQTFGTMGRVNADIPTAQFERAIADSVFDPRVVEDYIGPKSAGVKNVKEMFSSPSDFVSGVRAFSEFLPVTTERFARSFSFVAAQNIMRKGYGITDEDLIYDFSKRFVEITQYLYNTSDRSRLFTTPVGSMFGLFKNWQTHFIGSAYTYAGLGKKFIETGGKDGTLAPIGALLGSTSVLAGFTGLPLSATIDAISEKLTDKSIPEHLYGSFQEFDSERGTVSDAAYYGLPSYLPTLLGATGLSFGTSAAAPFADPVRDADLMSSFVLFNRAKYLGRSFSSAWSTAAVTGANPLLDAETQENFSRAMLPKTLYRAFAADNENVIRSISTGNPQVRDVGPAARTLYALGFNPTQVENQLEINSRLWRDQQTRRLTINEYGQEYLRALDTNMKEAESVLYRATLHGIDTSSVLRSARALDIRRDETPVERELKNEYLRRQLKSTQN